MLEQLQIVSDFGMCVVLWLVQLIIYPSFQRIAPERVLAWHARYTFRVSFIIMPLMLVQLGLSVWFFWLAPNWIHGLHLALVLVAWGLTFFVSVPLHDRISQGESDAAVFKALVDTNWPRTVLWTCLSVVSLGSFWIVRLS